MGVARVRLALLGFVVIEVVLAEHTQPDGQLISHLEYCMSRTKHVKLDIQVVEPL